MLLEAHQIKDVNYWCTYTIEVDGDVFDVTRINYTGMKIDCTFKFKRHKGLCFYELFLDYGTTFTSDLGFTELRNQLNTIIPYLELFKDFEETL